MKLSESFSSIAYKRLVAVEVDPARSNGHELNTGPGLSGSQLEEMREERVTLVISARDHRTHPKRWWSSLWSIEQFLDEVAGA